MKFVLDVKKWISGVPTQKGPPISTGVGNTALLNNLGYMCCLGQFASQCGVPEKRLLDNSFPAEIAGISPEYDAVFVSIPAFPGEGEGPGHPVSSILAADLIAINDDDKIGTKSRIQQMRERLEKDGHELVVTNFADRTAEERIEDAVKIAIEFTQVNKDRFMNVVVDRMIRAMAESPEAYEKILKRAKAYAELELGESHQ